MDAGTIIGKTFSKRLMGIDPDEVDFFLREVGEYVRGLQRQISQLHQQLADAELRKSGFNSVAEVIPTVLEEDQKRMSGADATGQENAGSVIADAERKAARILEQARSELSSIRESIMVLQAKKDSIATRLKMLLQSELDLVSSLEKESGMQGIASGSQEGELPADMAEIEEIIKSVDPER